MCHLSFQFWKKLLQFDANRKLSELLCGVRQGRSYIVAGHATHSHAGAPEISDPVAAGARPRGEPGCVLSRPQMSAVEEGRRLREEMRTTQDINQALFSSGLEGEPHSYASASIGSFCAALMAG